MTHGNVIPENYNRPHNILEFIDILLNDSSRTSKTERDYHE